MFIITIYQIDRHKAAVGECLLMAHNSQSSLLENRSGLVFCSTHGYDPKETSLYGFRITYSGHWQINQSKNAYLKS